MSTSASFAAISAGNAAIAASQADKARRENCKLVVNQFDSKSATTVEMQEYASCVNTLYPGELTGGETFLLKGTILLVFVGIALGIFKAHNEGESLPEYILYSVFGAILIPLGAWIILGLGYGLVYLFS